MSTDDLPLDAFMRRQDGRCSGCGWHVDTMGHEPGCSVLTLPTSVRKMGRPVEDVVAPDLLAPEPPPRIERPW